MSRAKASVSLKACGRVTGSQPFSLSAMPKACPLSPTFISQPWLKSKLWRGDDSNVDARCACAGKAFKRPRRREVEERSARKGNFDIGQPSKLFGLINSTGVIIYLINSVHIASCKQKLSDMSKSD